MTRAVKSQAPQPEEEPVVKPSIVELNSIVVRNQVRIARFRNRPMVLEHKPYEHFVPLHRDRFETIAYPILGGVSRSRISDVFAFISNTAEDLTSYEDYILFGSGDRAAIWDMDTLEFITGHDPATVVWRSPHAPAEGEGRQRVPFIMSLAGGDEGVYDDIMQSMAPMVMKQKPDGLIWWIGEGANGKSTLMDAIDRIFPGQLSSITVRRLCDGRDTPSLNGTLANVVKESSEGRIEDTEIYKSLGTHENFRVHRFHSQDDIEIRGNLHHIFSANSIPVFNDKGFSARRRTFIVPFTQQFESDPTFERKTFTRDMFSHLIAEMCYYAQQIKKQGYRYKWSATTLSAKLDYDSDANNAEEYAKHIISEGVVAFDSFNPVKMDYENWCADNGYVPLGITNLRRALGSLGFERITHGSKKVYRLKTVGPTELQLLSVGRPGLYTTTGFAPEPAKEETVPEFDEPTDEEPEEPKPSILKGKW